MDQCRVLVVEDEFDSAEMVSQILSYHNIAVETAVNGRDGLERLKEYLPDLIVTDISMPEVDGWRFLEGIRGNDVLAHLPVVAVTAYHSKQVEMDAKKAGFDAYFQKPIDVDAFIAKLEDLLESC
ncbi:MAG: response regulator [Chloroflexi bacterium]|nr:response regulator [Chloroflexota bacterium]